MMKKSLFFAISCFLTLGVNGINVDVISNTMSSQDRKETIVAVTNTAGQAVEVSVDAQCNNNSDAVNVLFRKRVIRSGSTDFVKVVSDSNDDLEVTVDTSIGERKVVNIGKVKPSETKTVANENYVFVSRNGLNYITKETSR